MVKSNRIKKENYELLIGRMKVAQEKEFFLEQTWIAYAIIEDRILSILDKIGLIQAHSIIMLNAKIRILTKEKASRSELRKIFYDDILKRIIQWAKKRNKLMHALASEKKKIDIADPNIKDIAQTGESLAREISARVWSLKKILSKK